MPAIGSWSPSKASSPLLSRGSRGACAFCRRAGPLLRLEVLRVAKPRWGGGKEEWDKSGLGGGRVGGCAGSALGFVFQILLGDWGGVYALGTSCIEAFRGGDGLDRGVSSSLKVLTN